jgi:hypothetical protein
MTDSRIEHRPRRSWLAEALVVAGVLAFGGFALVTESGLGPADLIGSLLGIIAH